MLDLDAKLTDDYFNCQKYMDDVVSEKILKLLHNKIRTEIDENKEPVYKRIYFIVSLNDDQSIKVIIMKTVSNLLSLVPYVMRDELTFDNSDHLSMPIDIKFSCDGLHLGFETENKDHGSEIYSVNIIGIRPEDLISKLVGISDESKYFESIELFGLLEGGIELSGISRKLDEYKKNKPSNIDVNFTSTYSLFKEKELV